ncbi:hypothetical protein [Deinococcus sp. 6GRE01]|uniref:hypothetical protein n=1 Tax=Deinococcus sp. 6GRE01 TaxID=2745873 RepID=UPI001E2E5B1C|nr:hypothetical protein [Deinococcus sp. 6GRE01]MCD0156015.1 hypothetical protein [Deinococcus sp. 6GRE01]
METLSQQLQDAFTAAGQTIPVYLGSEWLSREVELPHVIVTPGGGTYAPPSGATRDALASVELEPHVICKAVLFEEALLLADFAYAALTPSRSARVSLRSEAWGDYTVRVADLTLSVPATLTRTDITRVRVTRFTQLASLIGSQEVPNDPTPEIDGETQFVETD